MSISKNLFKNTLRMKVWNMSIEISHNVTKMLRIYKCKCGKYDTILDTVFLRISRLCMFNGNYGFFEIIELHKDQ